MTRTTTAALSLLLMTACSGAGDADEAPPPDTSGGESAAAFGFDEALAAARERMPDGHPIEVEHETMDGVALLEVELIDGDVVREIFFDPSTGEVVREGEETLSAVERAALPDLRAAVAARGRALEDALALARRHHDNASIREIELSWADARLTVEVEIDIDGAAQAHRYPLDEPPASPARIDSAEEEELYE